MIILGLSANWGATLPKGNLIGDLTSNFLVESCQVKVYFVLNLLVFIVLFFSNGLGFLFESMPRFRDLG